MAVRARIRSLGNRGSANRALGGREAGDYCEDYCNPNEAYQKADNCSSSVTLRHEWFLRTKRWRLFKVTITGSSPARGWFDGYPGLDVARSKRARARKYFLAEYVSRLTVADPEGDV